MAADETGASVKTGRVRERARKASVPRESRAAVMTSSIQLGMKTTLG